MKKRILLFILTLVLLFVNCSTVYAKETKFVHDSFDVISEESIEYITSINQDVFATYEIKPQFSVFITDQIPSGYTLEEYKEEKFKDIYNSENDYGILLLFVMDNKQYAFETGIGYKDKIALSEVLKVDFIDNNADMQQYLRDKDFDPIAIQTLEYLEHVLEKEEDGVYTQKDLKKELEIQTAKQTIILLILLITIIVLISIISKKIYTFTVVRKTINNPKMLSCIDLHKKQIRKRSMKNIKENNSSDIKYETLKTMYEIYLEEAKDKLLNVGSKEKIELYMKKFKEVNTFNIFASTLLTPYKDIVQTVEKEEEKRAKILKTNKQLVNEYIDNNLNRIDKEHVDEKLLRKRIEEQCSSSFIFEKSDIETIFSGMHKNLVSSSKINNFISNIKPNTK